MDLSDLDRPIARSDQWHTAYHRSLNHWLAGHDTHDLATFDDEALKTMLDLMLKAHREQTDYAEMGKRMAAALLAYVNDCAIAQANICQLNGTLEES